MITNLPTDRESFVGTIEKIEEKWKMQEACNHEFGQPTNTLIGYGRQCTKCYYIEKVKKPVRRLIRY